MARVGNWVVAALVMACAWEAGAVERTRSPRSAATRSKNQPIAEAELALPQESALGEDHQKNLEALQREKLEALRSRLEVLTRAMAVGRARPGQVDHATIEQLQVELEIQDRPHLRIQTLKRIVELRQKIEADAKQGMSSPRGKPGDLNPWLAAHNRYTSAKLARINAQMALEREQIALQGEKAKDDASAEKAK